MISPVSEWKTSWTVSDKMINKIIKSNVIQSILDWVSAKAKAAEMAELRKLNKEGAKFNLKHIKKFNDATSNDRQNTSILLAEGDSAAGPIRGARDPKLHGVFPLRGRPINVSAAPLSKVKENEEFENIRLILGLKYGEDADLNSLNFGKVIIASDADEFGHSIAGLILNMFYRLWPNLVKAGRIYRLVTPVAIVQHKKEQLEFFTLHDFEEWRKKNESAKYTYKFLKGLGSSPPALWKKYMTNLDNYLVQFTLQDAQDAATMDLCFLKDADSADKRKVWLDIE
jgi:DNA topoisomerase-2